MMPRLTILACSSELVGMVLLSPVDDDQLGVVVPPALRAEGGTGRLVATRAGAARRSRQRWQCLGRVDCLSSLPAQRCRAGLRPAPRVRRPRGWRGRRPPRRQWVLAELMCMDGARQRGRAGDGVVSPRALDPA